MLKDSKHTALFLMASTPSEAGASAPIDDLRIIMHTEKGDIEATLFASKVPRTAANFLNLAKHGYYNGLTFHRVIADFMIQGGDPTGSGRGGPGYQFADEIHPSLKHNRAGILSMANAGPNSNGSQFFITHAPTPWLDGKHSVFGVVDRGQDVVLAIKQGDKIISIDLLDNPGALFAAKSRDVAEWNKKLNYSSPK